MLNKKESCDLEQLRRLATTGLDMDSDLAKHVEHCVDCQQQLEIMTNWAANTGMLSGLSEALKPDEYDAASGFASERGDSASGACAADPLAAKRPSIESIRRLLMPTDNPSMWGRLGRYEIVGLIGFGGMSLVLKGFEPALNRFVAIKMLSPQLATVAIARKRFAREARATAAIQHPNVVPIHQVEDQSDPPYLVMPYLGDVTLRKRICSMGWLPISMCLRIGLQVAAGLAAAHRQGLVHRDIKPANILLEENTERVVVTDFGLARASEGANLTLTGIVAGTPEFMSPEQAEGAPIDSRSDLFSLGSVLYMMATGESPFRRETPLATIRAVADLEPLSCREINPDIPAWYETLVSRLISKDRSRRLQSAETAAQIMEQSLAHLQQPGKFAIPSALRSTSRRSAVRWMAASLLAIFMACICWMAFQEDWTAPKINGDNSFISRAFEQNGESVSVARKLQMWKEMRIGSSEEKMFAEELAEKYHQHLESSKETQKENVVRQWAIQLLPFAVAGVPPEKAVLLWELSHPGRQDAGSPTYEMRLAHAFACARRGFADDATGEINLLIGELKKLPGSGRVQFLGKVRTHEEILHECFGYRSIIKSINVTTLPAQRSGGGEDEKVALPPDGNESRDSMESEAGDKLDAAGNAERSDAQEVADEPDTKYLNFAEVFRKTPDAPPFVAELEGIKSRPSLLQASKNNLVVFEVDRNQLIHKAVRDEDAAKLGVHVWARINRLFPLAYRRELVQFNLHEGRRLAGYFGGDRSNDVGRPGYKLSVAKYVAAEEAKLTEVNRTVSARRGTMDWTLVHEMGHYICLRSYAIELFSQRFDGDQMPQPRRRKRPNDYPEDGSPKLNGNFVTSYAERVGGDEEAVESFTTYMTVRRLPTNDSLAAQKVRFFAELPGFPELREHIQAIGRQ